MRCEEMNPVSLVDPDLLLRLLATIALTSNFRLWGRRRALRGDGHKPLYRLSQTSRAKVMSVSTRFI